MIRGNDGNYYGAQYRVGLFKLDLSKQEKKEILVEGCLLYTSPSPQTVLDLVCRLLLEKKHVLSS